MAFTQAQLDALEEAIASGTLEVQYSDKKVTYRSMSDMLRARDLIMRKLGLTSAANSRVYPQLSKGMDSCSPSCLEGCECSVCGFQGRGCR